MTPHAPASAPPLLLAITACPTGIAHTYMAAENLEAAAKELGFRLKVETHGSIGVEGTFSAADIRDADAILIGSDIVIPTDRFVGKRLLATDVDDAIKHPRDLLQRALEAPALGKADAQAVASDEEPAKQPGLKGIGQTLYKALMNGVSHMIPFVVTGGLLIAVALSIGGTPTEQGMVVPEDSFWNTILSLGTLAFSLMVPILSGYIAVGIADRPGLAPGLITGLIATTGSLYGSEAGAGFIGGILTGIMSGYVALAIRKIPVNKFVAPIWPIIVIPIVTTLIVGLVFIYVIGNPVAAAFEALTNYLAGMQGSSAIVLGAIIGAMITFDMGGPFNKTAFLFGGGLIAAGNAAPMGMAAAAIAVPPLAVGVATLMRRAWFTKAENDAGIAALFMGFFGITEGAIPLAAARPLQVIPANVIGGAVAGALAGAVGVKDNVMHGGPIVAVLGAVENTLGFVLALAAGVAVTAALIIALVGISRRKLADAPAANADSATTDVSATNAAPKPTPTESDLGAKPAAESFEDDRLIRLKSISLDTPLGAQRDDVIGSLVELAGQGGRITDSAAVVQAALAREEKHSTGVGFGVAIPHARVASVAQATVAFARLPQPGIRWADDEDPSDLVFLIAVPENAGNQHLKVLSKLARHLSKQDFRDRLRAAATPADALAVINEAIS